MLVCKPQKIALSCELVVYGACSDWLKVAELFIPVVWLYSLHNECPP